LVGKLSRRPHDRVDLQRLGESVFLTFFRDEAAAVQEAHDSARAELTSGYAGDKVLFVLAGGGDEDVGVAHFRVLQHARGRDRAADPGDLETLQPRTIGFSVADVDD